MSLRHDPLPRWKRTESALLPLRYVPASDRQCIRGPGLGALPKPDLDQCDADLSQVFADCLQGVLLGLRIAAQSCL